MLAKKGGMGGHMGQQVRVLMAEDGVAKRKDCFMHVFLYEIIIVDLHVGGHTATKRDTVFQSTSIQ